MSLTLSAPSDRVVALILARSRSSCGCSSSNSRFGSLRRRSCAAACASARLSARVGSVGGSASAAATARADSAAVVAHSHLSAASPVHGHLSTLCGPFVACCSCSLSAATASAAAARCINASACGSCCGGGPRNNSICWARKQNACWGMCRLTSGISASVSVCAADAAATCARVKLLARRPKSRDTAWARCSEPGSTEVNKLRVDPAGVRCARRRLPAVTLTVTLANAGAVAATNPAPRLCAQWLPSMILVFLFLQRCKAGARLFLEPLLACASLLNARRHVCGNSAAHLRGHCGRRGSCGCASALACAKCCAARQRGLRCAGRCGAAGGRVIETEGLIDCTNTGVLALSERWRLNLLHL